MARAGKHELGGGMKLNSKVILTIFLSLFSGKGKNRADAQKIRGFFHENTWCLFWMSPLTSDAVATYTYGASREACKAHGSTY